MKRSNLFWGSAIVILGAVLLASNLGVVRGNLWVFFWPALVILAGVWFLLKANRKGQDAQAVVSNIPLESATGAEIEFNHGAGRLEVNAAANAGDLISGSFIGGVTADVDRSSTVAKVHLHTPTDLVFDGPWPVGGHGYEWKVGVTPDVPVKLHFHTGASESKLDLSGLKASEIVVETGASATELTLPVNAGFSKVEVKSGVASVKIEIPTGVAANIHVQSGLAGINIDATRFVKDGEYYRSADYASATNKVDLFVETGVGSVEIH
jgi:cbb3-type cytochrome oxidase subunit 3